MQKGPKEGQSNTASVNPGSQVALLGADIRGWLVSNKGPLKKGFPLEQIAVLGVPGSSLHPLSNCTAYVALSECPPHCFFSLHTIE